MKYRQISEGKYSFRVKVYDAQVTDCTDHWRCLRVNSDHSRIYAVENGCANVYVEDRVVPIEPGYLYLFPLHQTADYICDDRMRLHWLHIRCDILPGLDVFDRLQSTALIQPFDDLAAFEELEYCMDQRTPKNEMQAVAIASRFVAEFMPESWDELVPNSLSRLQASFATVEEHYSDPDLALEDLAGSCELNPAYFSALFSKHMRTTPIRFLTRYRLGEAKRRLANGDESVTAIARACGFRDPHYFSRVFSRAEGRSPTEHRQLFSHQHV